MIINYSISKRVLERIICCCSCPCVHNAPRHEWGADGYTSNPKCIVDGIVFVFVLYCLFSSCMLKTKRSSLVCYESFVALAGGYGNALMHLVEPLQCHVHDSAGEDNDGRMHGAGRREIGVVGDVG